MGGFWRKGEMIQLHYNPKDKMKKKLFLIYFLILS